MSRGVITSIRQEAAEIKSFRIKLESTFKYMPGQYVMVAYPESNDVRKPFSVASLDEKSNEILLVIRMKGSFTQRLFSAKENEGISVFGPYGRFVLPAQEETLVFIAGGIGITPLYSMLLEVCNSAYSKRLYLFYSSKKRGEMALIDELQGIKDSRIKIKYFFTKEQAGVENSLCQRIDCSTMKGDVPEFYSSLFYICGPQRMISGVTGQLVESGIEPDMIKSEDFS